jgi:DNA/RNA endonuclease G (NUC1)
MLMLQPIIMPSILALTTHSASFCLGAAVVSVLMTITANNSDVSVPQEEKTKTSHLSSITKGKHDYLLPKLPLQLFTPNDNMLIAFDTRTKNPAFVLERICTQQEVAGSDEKTQPSRKNMRFFEEKTLPAHHRSRNQHYRNSGYDRGHLAPAADFKKLEKEVHDSFSLSNVSPQLPMFNRSVWLRVEEFVRRVAQDEQTKDDDEVETWVMTGPLWLPASNGKNKHLYRYSYEAIGYPPSLVHVPTHFFKVVVVLSPATNDNGPRFKLKNFAAFVIPHKEPNENSTTARLRLVDCVVSLTDLEAVSGLEFFPRIFGSHEEDSSDDALPIDKELADALTDDVRVQAKSNYHQLNQDGASEHNRGDIVLSKRRQKRVKQLLRGNSPPLFQHLCKESNACFKYLI